MNQENFEKALDKACPILGHGMQKSVLLVVISLSSSQKYSLPNLHIM